jgi:hypothetical protein
MGNKIKHDFCSNFCYGGLLEKDGAKYYAALDVGETLTKARLDRKGAKYLRKSILRKFGGVN